MNKCLHNNFSLFIEHWFLMGKWQTKVTTGKLKDVNWYAREIIRVTLIILGASKIICL
jgi:hypothetical protein